MVEDSSVAVPLSVLSGDAAVAEWGGLKQQRAEPPYDSSSAALSCPPTLSGACTSSFS